MDIFAHSSATAIEPDLKLKAKTKISSLCDLPLAEEAILPYFFGHTGQILEDNITFVSL